MEGWTHLPRSEAMQKARYRARHSSPTRRAIEEEIKYVSNHPEESIRIENLGTATFDNWYKTMRGVLLRVARGIERGHYGSPGRRANRVSVLEGD